MTRAAVLVFVDRAAIGGAGVCCELTNLPNWHQMTNGV